jgi:pimeloyl-ACP methyl ester carboxylesterase
VAAVVATKYAKSGNVHIAYQVIGNGPRDLVISPGIFSHLELFWEDPSYARWMERLQSFARVIAFDKRGQGLSDRGFATPPLEERMDDVRAVMDAAGSERAAVMGISEGGALAILFAATYPARTTALILFGTAARWAWAPDYQWARTPEQIAQVMSRWEAHWGEPAVAQQFAPSRKDDPAFLQWWGKLERMSTSPSDVNGLLKTIFDIDLRNVLRSIKVPTLVLHRVGEVVVPLQSGRHLAEHIPNAKLVELNGSDHWPWTEGADDLTNEIQEFLTGTRPSPEPDRVLATVLFVDIVGSTDRLARLGDQRWRDVLESYYALVGRQVSRFGGRKIDTAGDGVFASFDGPARAVRCATAIRDAVPGLGLDVRAGVHTGECEIIGDRLGGIAVHIGARVAANAGSCEVLVSSTVKDLVAGSGIKVADRGIRALKGVPGEWRLFAVI